MIKIGLSGNRYSGKSTVANIFKQISIPVFDADIITKFILNYNYDLLREIKEKLGNGIFVNRSDNELQLDFRKLKKDNFNSVIDIIEDDIFKAYKRFSEKDKERGGIYTIFHSSMLFEREWNEKMDMSINVHASDTDRMKRCRYLTNTGLLTIKELSRAEMPSEDKSDLAYFVINNNNDSSIESGLKTPTSILLKQVNDIDEKIINEYLYSQIT